MVSLLLFLFRYFPQLTAWQVSGVCGANVQQVATRESQAGAEVSLKNSCNRDVPVQVSMNPRLATEEGVQVQMRNVNSIFIVLEIGGISLSEAKNWYWTFGEQASGLVGKAFF